MGVFNPENVSELIENALIQLGKPVIEINVAEPQLFLAAKQAIAKFCDYHYDATETVFVSHEITDQDIINGYITTPDNIWNVTRILNVSTFPSVFGGGVGLYQKHGSTSSMGSVTAYGGNTMNGMRGMLGMSEAMVSYYLASAHASYFKHIINPNIGMTWNRGSKRIRFQGSMEQSIRCGKFLIYEAQVVNEDISFSEGCLMSDGNGTCFFDNNWLLDYTTALIQKQWGRNLSKFRSIPIMDGMEMNGEHILEEAKQDLERLEEELLNKYTIPPIMIIG